MLEEILDGFGKEIVKGLRANMASKGLNNTGKTSASIRYEVKGEGENLDLIIYAEEHILVLNDGAKAISRKTTGDFIKNITKWAQQKLGKDPKEARGLAYGYLQNRLGNGTGGLTTDAQGNYLVPNRFNSGGVLSDTLNDGLVQKINNGLAKGYNSLIVESFSKFVKDGTNS